MVASAQIQLSASNSSGNSSLSLAHAPQKAAGQGDFAGFVAALTGARAETPAGSNSTGPQSVARLARAAGAAKASGRLSVDKNGRRLTVRLDSQADLDQNLVEEVAAALNRNPGIKEIVIKLAHGSGSHSFEPRTLKLQTATAGAGKKNHASASQADQDNRALKAKGKDEPGAAQKADSGKIRVLAHGRETNGKQPAARQPAGGFDAKTWLRQQLAEKGIHTDNIRIEVRPGEALKQTGSQADIGPSNEHPSVPRRSAETTQSPETATPDEPGARRELHEAASAGKLSRPELTKPQNLQARPGATGAEETHPSELAESQSEQRQNQQQHGRHGHRQSAAETPGQTEPGAKRAPAKAADERSFKDVGRALAAGKIGGQMVPAKAVGTAGAAATPVSQMAQALEKIANMAEQQLTSSGKKLEVQIDIKDVGKVLVGAVRSAGQIQLQIRVESHGVRHLLQSQLRPLIEHLTRDGVEVGKVQVTVRDELEDYQQHGEFAQTRHDQRQRFEERRGHFRQPARAPGAGVGSWAPLPALAGANGSMEIWA